MTSPLALLKAFVLLLALVCLPVAVVMLACGVTWTGLGLGLAVGRMGIGPLLGCIGDERCSTRQVWLGKGLLGLGSPWQCGSYSACSTMRSLTS